MMDAKSSAAAALKEESVLPFMPSIARRITLFTKKEIAHFIRSSRLIINRPELDIRVARENTSYALGRILIATPKRIGTAPQRNLVRRRLKAIFYQEQLYNYPYVFLVFCKKKSTLLTFTELKTILAHAAQLLE
jgi:ribonuclease P protein component